ncbi:protein LURP-one-related 17-like [Rhododendron vialii]|uniref:protein LURP-one-related 17-like n=1 Tax=Rhododendron vialii TaxID=182163 RepID=UPI00265E0C11|nr:protein LURP-one-related 17-like [Rhododendron vialii]
MNFFFKSISRSRVHEINHVRTRVQECKSGGAWQSLTVWRKSLLLSCNGFTVIDSNGNLIFRVENYAGRPEEVTLMDGAGKPVLTICRRNKLRVLADNWFVYEGHEVGDSSSRKPIFCARKRITILQPRVNAIARVYHQPFDKRSVYVIEGSYANRSCQVLDESRMVVAEIKKKESVNGGTVSFGAEVFLLIIRPGFSPSFAMAIVLLLDQMFS